MACIRKRRGKWVLDYRDQFGIRHWKTTKGTRKEAEFLLNKIQREINNGEYISDTNQKLFEDLADLYINNIKLSVRATTAKDYERNLRLHLKPYFKGLKIRLINLEMIEKFQSNLLDKGVGIRTINKCLTLLGSILRYAVKHKWLSHNAASFVKKLKTSTSNLELIDNNILTPDEIAKLLDASEGRWKIIIMTAILTGLRQGELLGLQWGDIDWNSKHIHVRRSFTGGRFYEPKTKYSRRRVDMPLQLMTELKTWKLKCPVGKLELVFPNGAGNPENHGNLLRRGFYPALRRAKLRRIRFHDLRHTYASLLIANKEEPKRIQTLLGHSSIKITYDVYGHLIPNPQDGVADRLADLALSGSKMVATRAGQDEDDLQVLEIMVARGGIEPPTQGFSVLCSTD